MMGILLLLIALPHREDAEQTMAARNTNLDDVQVASREDVVVLPAVDCCCGGSDEGNPTGHKTPKQGEGIQDQDDRQQGDKPVAPFHIPVICEPTQFEEWKASSGETYHSRRHA